MQLTWSMRAEPMPVEGCWAEGQAALQLRKKIRPDLGLRGVTFGSLLILLGSNVPWVDSLVYLGRQEMLYLPTLWQPDLPYEWLVARLSQLGPPPWALIPPGRALGLSAASTVP